MLTYDTLLENLVSLAIQKVSTFMFSSKATNVEMKNEPIKILPGAHYDFNNSMVKIVFSTDVNKVI